MRRVLQPLKDNESGFFFYMVHTEHRVPIIISIRYSPFMYRIYVRLHSYNVYTKASAMHIIDCSRKIILKKKKTASNARYAGKNIET